MRIAIAGGSGFIGRHLVRHIVRQGGEAIVLSRSPRRRPIVVAESFPANANGLRNGLRVVSWNEAEDDPSLLEGLDAFVNLAGETINRRWTRAGKRAIVDSRIEATHRTAALIDKVLDKPRVVLSGSAVGFYGRSKQEEFDERSPGTADRADFLARVCEQWERESDLIRGARVVKLRIGLVLGKDGGALPKMVLPFRFGIGGKIGNGRQWMSWIHVDDIVRIIDDCIRDERIVGAVNCTAPNPVTNETFMRMLGEVMRRPALIPLPAPVLKLVLGEMSTLLLDGQRVMPRVLLEHGFTFRFPHLRDALIDLLSSPNAQRV